MANYHVGVIARSSFERARSSFHWMPTIPKFRNFDFTACPYFSTSFGSIGTLFTVRGGSFDRERIDEIYRQESRCDRVLRSRRETIRWIDRWIAIVSALEGRVTRSPGRGLYVVSSASWSALNLTAPPATRKLDAGRRVDSSPSVARSNAGVRGKRRDASVPDNPERPQTTRRNRCVPSHRRRNLRRVLPFIFLRFFCSHTLRRLWHRPTDTYVF